MQSFLVNDKNLWVYILHVFYCITLVFSLKENKIPQSLNAFIVGMDSFRQYEARMCKKQ